VRSGDDEIPRRRVDRKRILGPVTDSARGPEEPPGPSVALKRPWLIFDAYAEARAMVRMYVDPRYRLTWTTRVVPAVLLALILTSWIWVPLTSILPGFLSTLLVKTVDLVLAFFAYKILSREARRYRETSPDLPPALRL